MALINSLYNAHPDEHPTEEEACQPDYHKELFIILRKNIREAKPAYKVRSLHQMYKFYCEQSQTRMRHKSRDGKTLWLYQVARYIERNQYRELDMRAFSTNI